MEAFGFDKAVIDEVSQNIVFQSSHIRGTSLANYECIKKQIPYAYVYNVDCPEMSELGEIRTHLEGGMLYQIS